MMELHISTPTTFQTCAVVWVEIATPIGDITIQEGHEPALVTLMPQSNIFYRLTTGKQESLAVTQGIAHITRTSLTLLIA